MDISFGIWHATATTNRKSGGLAPREAEHLMALASGLTQKQIAQAFGVSPRTVRHSLERVYGKLGAMRAPGAVADAIRRGWIAPLLIALVIGGLLDADTDAIRVRQPGGSRPQVSTSRVVSRRDTGSVYA